MAAPTGSYIAFFLSTLTVYWAALEELVSQETAFFLFSVLLIGYLGFEMYHHARRHGEAWLISPVVLASLFLFLFPFGLSNIIFLLSTANLGAVKIIHSGYTWMNRAMILAMLGAWAMWLGYRLRLGQQIAVWLWRLPSLNKVLRKTYELRWSFIVVCVLLGLAGRVQLVRLGIFGYNSEVDLLYEYAAYTQYFHLLTQLSTLALVGLSLAYYSESARQPLLRWIWLLVLLHEVAWGFLSGFKAQVVMPLIIVFLCRYLVTRRISRNLAIAGIVLLFTAYAIIEPYRHLRYQDPYFQNRNVSYIAATMIDVAQGEVSMNTVQSDADFIALRIASRSNLTQVAARAVEFKHRNSLPPDAPAFLNNILLAPAYAVVPRLLWPEKPELTTGAWFYRTVLGGASDVTSVGMSPAAYLYLAGGALAVFLGFMLLGIAQRVVHDRFFYCRGGALTVFLGLTSVLVDVNSEFYAFIVTFIRYVPLLFLVQYLMFKK